MAITISIVGSINITDGQTGTVAYTKLFAGLAMTGSAFTELQTASIGTSPVSISLPISPTQFVYIKNLHPSQTLSVTWTPNGGGLNPVVTLEPGSAITFLEAAGGAGITALSLTGSGAGTTAEFVLGG